MHAPPPRAFAVPSRALRAAAVAAALIASSVFANGRPAAAAEEDLPPGVVARVYGEDVTEAQLLDRLARRHESTERGREVLDQIVDDTIVGIEAKRRGVTVTDDEVERYFARLEEVVKRQSGGDRTLADVLTETKTTAADFRRTTTEYLVREKMAREDLGAKTGEDVPEHRMKLWMSSLRRRMDVRTTDLPEGTLARIGPDVTIDRARFARELRDRLPAETVSGVRAELVLDAATRHAVRRAGVTVTDADVDAQVAKLRTRFESNPRVEGTGVTFDQFLKQTFGIGEADLRKDPTFRSRVGLERLLLRDITDAAVRTSWEENRDAYGDRTLVRQVYVPAGEQGGKFQVRSFAEAQELALRAKVEVLQRAGLLEGAGPSKKLPLADVVTAVAKEFTPEGEERTHAGEPVAWTRANVAGEPALEKAVFEGELGTLAGPVRSRVGWHLLLVEERRPAPAWDEVKERVREDLLRAAVRRFQLGLRMDENVVFAK